MRITYNRTTLILALLKNSKERVCFLPFLISSSIGSSVSNRIHGSVCFRSSKQGIQAVYSFVSGYFLSYFCRSGFFCVFCSSLCSRFCSSLCGSCYLCILSINLSEHREHLTNLIRLKELKISRTLEELTYTFGLFYARELDKNTTRLVELLDIRLNHTKAVDTRTEHIKRVGNSAFYFFADHLLYLCVGRVERHLVFQFKRREHRCKLCVRVNFFVRLYEERDEISLAVFLLFFGSSHGFGENF